MSLVNAEFVEHGDDVAHLLLQNVGSGIVGLVALAVAPCIDKDEAIGVLNAST